ncbi:MAG: hypothetical protein IK152_08400 [Lachnospiraceae bacterium]|nr:hypothetical protein [Lachnospiraceae bacterium]
MDKTYMNNEGEYGKYIIQDLQAPQTGTPEFQEMYKKFSHRILWIDKNVCPGAFQMNTAWYYAVPEKDPVFEEHQHDDDEIIGFFGCDPDDPYNLHAELDVTINGEHHILTKSSLIFCPAGMPHMRISIKRVDKPIFHFSVVTGGTYNGGAYK